VRIVKWQRGNQVVTLVGMMHVASPRFYRRIRAKIVRLESAGAQVQLEGVRQPPMPAEAYPPAEVELVRRIRGLLPRLHKVFTVAGWGLQTDLLKPEPTWVNTDVDAIEMIRAMDDPDEWLDRLEEVLELVEQHERAARVACAIIGRVVFYSGAVRRLLHRIGGKESGAVIDLRNASAVRAIVAATTDVVALWGDGHLDGIGELLRARGYRRLT
jgi:hypothetical protein